MSRASRDGFRPRFFVTQGGSGVNGAEKSVTSRPDGLEVALDPDDSHHVSTVLRLRAGDECEVVLAPSGEVHLARVAKLGSPVLLTLGARLAGDDAGARYRREVWLVQGLARPAAVDYLIEKGTETGASRFLLVSCAGSPRLPDGSVAGRLARWRKLAREAAKQSKQVAIPSVDFAASLEDALAQVGRAGARSVFLDPRADMALDELVRGLAGSAAFGEGAGGQHESAAIALWVGPESGWSEHEYERLRAAGVEAARLGRSVLRTETAGPVAVALVRLGLRDW